MANIAKNLAQIISQSNSKKTGPYDTPAKVKRIEGNTVWVSIPGGIDETPIEKTVNCSVGDNVQIRVGGGRAWITGNATAPPTDDTTAIKADTTANKAQVIAVDAKETAEAVEGIATNASTTAASAMTIAEGVNEHFWHDSGGAHVTEVTQEEWNDSSDPNYHSGGNTLITTQGMAIRNGLDNLAQFGSTGAVIGEVANGNSRTEISTSGMQIYQRDSGNDISIANLGYGPGNDDGGSTSDAPYYTLGTRTGTVGNYSVAEGYNTEASGFCSHAEGEDTTASDIWAHAEGKSTTASEAEAHAEGQGTTASGYAAHAEGSYTNATGINSHAEGSFTTASDSYTHSQNYHTIADRQYQTAIGKYNTKNNTNNLFAIGNGTADNARSDAFTVDTSGNVALAGAVQSFFKIVEVPVSVASISAHANSNLGTQTVPAGDRPSGMVLVGTLGYQCTNYRIVPYNYYVDGTHSFTLAMVNTTAASSAAATFTAKLLYMKATSA